MLVALRATLQGRGLSDAGGCDVDAVGVDGRWALLPQAIDRLLSREPDVLVALGAVAALAAQRATCVVPILYAIVLDPSDVGLSAPNIGGVTTFDPEQATRHLRLLRQLLPGLQQVACLADPTAPTSRDGHNPLAAAIARAAQAEGLALTCIPMPDVDTGLGDAFGTALDARAGALVALEVPAVLARLGDIASMAERHRLPTLFPYGRSHGGILMQGASLLDAIDPLAAQIAALSRGAAVSHLPRMTVRHPRLVLDRGLARRIGLSIPDCVRERATLCIDDVPGGDTRTGR
jgi:putative ABC transport system substrate-binding protein